MRWKTFTFLYDKFTQDNMYQILLQSVRFCRLYMKKTFWCVFFSSQCRLTALSCGIKISALHCLVLSQNTRVTDRRMYDSQDCGKNPMTTPRTAVKIQWRGTTYRVSMLALLLMTSPVLKTSNTWQRQHAKLWYCISSWHYFSSSKVM